MQQIIDSKEKQIQSLNQLFLNSPGYKHYVKVSSDAKNALLVRREADGSGLYIDKLKTGDSVLTNRQFKASWVEFGPNFNGFYFNVNLSIYLAKLLNSNKLIGVPKCEYLSIPMDGYNSVFVVTPIFEQEDITFSAYLNVYGVYSTVGSNAPAMPVPSFLVPFLQEELKMRYFNVR